MDFITPAVVGIGALSAVAVIFPAISQSLKMQPYLYASTRCSARSGFFLKEKDYAELMQVTYPKELFALMENTRYKEIFERHDNFKEISTELDKNLFETFNWFEEIVPKNIKKLVNVIKRRFEIREIKRYLNAFMANEKIPEPMFVEDPMLKVKLQEVRNFQDLTNVVEGTFYANVFSEKSIDDIPKIITLLDRAWLVEISLETRKIGKEAEAFKEYLMAMIDLFNIRLAFRKQEKQLDISFIEGGHLDIKELESVNDLNKLETIIEKTQYKEYFNKESFLKMELSFFKYLRKLGNELNAKYTLTVGPIVTFMIEKELEIRNINLIVKLKLDNIPKEEIEKLVV